jgi:hypothetical protein
LKLGPDRSQPSDADRESTEKHGRSSSASDGEDRTPPTESNLQFAAPKTPVGRAAMTLAREAVALFEAGEGRAARSLVATFATVLGAADVVPFAAPPPAPVGTVDLAAARAAKGRSGA